MFRHCKYHPPRHGRPWTYVPRLAGALDADIRSIYHVYLRLGDNMPTQRAALLLKFKDDTLATVSRESVKSMAKKLGFNETQVAHYALARLREELLAKSSRPIVARDRKHGSSDDDDYAPLTAEE